jgi:SAM-dependent methyltransferase
MQPACSFPRDADEARDERFYPLDVGFCPKCGLVQTMQPVGEQILFSDGYHHIAGLSSSFREHLRELAGELAGLPGSGTRPRSAVEIGSNDGSLLRELGGHGFDAVGVDPCGTEPATGQPVIREYFGSALARRLLRQTGSADVFVALNTLAHVTDLHDVLDGIRLLLSDGGTFVSESHYLPALLQSLQYDFIYHEHARYYSLGALEAAFRPHGLEIYRIRRIPTHGGSVRVYAGLAGAHEPDDSVAALRGYEAALELTSEPVYREFAARTASHRDRFRGMLNQLSGDGSRIAGASFPARAVTLLNYCALGPAEICFISEISELKVGRLSPGTHIPIIHQSVLQGPSQPPYTLLLSWHIAGELVPRLRQGGFKGKFIIPLPEPRIIDD